MDRLTKRAKDGLAYSDIPLNQSSVLDVNENIVECYTGFIAERLAAYEDVGLQPHHIDSIIGQLLGYLDAEQAGLLIKLPCKVGTELFHVRTEVYADGYSVEYKKVIKEIELTNHNIFEIKRNWNKTVFLTREEAEKALLNQKL